MNQSPHLHVLVTRPDPQGTELCLHINDLGGKATYFPTIAFAPPSDPAAFQAAIQNLGDQEWLIFISPQSVYASVGAIRTAWPELSATVKFAAVGASTAKALQQAGYNVQAFPPHEWNSEGLLALPEFQQITNTKIAIIRGEGGREKIDHVLSERGARILPVIAYQRVLPKVDVESCLTLLKAQHIDVIICTSYDSVRNLKLLLGETGWPYLKNVPLMVVSERIKVLAEGLGFQTIWVTRNASNNAILEMLMKMRET